MFFIQTTIFGQEFAPVGAKWYVQVAEPFGPEWIGTLTNESIRDTTMKGLSCKVIYKSQATILNEIVGEYILCQSGDSVFHYMKSLDTMNLVMDFGAEVGESWESFDRANEFESFGNERNYKYIVDDITYIHLINQAPLKVQHLTVLQKDWSQADSEYVWEGQTDELIESLGFKSALLPSNGGDGFTDDQYETDIRCYEDPIIGLVKLLEDENCTLTSTKNINFDRFEILPNPTSGLLKIEGLLESSDIEVFVFNFNSKLIHKAHCLEELDLTSFENGVYYIQIRSNEYIITRKIVLLK